VAIIQVKDATGSVLDWMVAKCESTLGYYVQPNEKRGTTEWKVIPQTRRYSTNWTQGGPIIDREIGNLWKHNKLDPNEPDVWTAAAYCKAPDGTLLYYEDGPTPLIAAMRCYVTSKLGDEIEVPEELI